MPPYVAAAERKKIGHITPSSNTVLEPLTACITASLDAAVSHHFTRIRVEGISLDERHTGQFTAEHMVSAAVLLADSQVDAIVWNGTSGGWNGIEADREICDLIEVETGIPASTATLAQLRAVELAGASTVGIAAPYTADVVDRVAEVYSGTGLAVAGTSHLGVHVNRDFAHVTPDQARALLREADSPEAECLLFICTGVAASQLVEEMEAELGKPIIDTVSVIAWEALRMVGIQPQLEGWGWLLAGAGVRATQESA